MERKSKLSLSLTLAIIGMLLIPIFMTTVKAAVIGDPGFVQPESFDSNPTSGTFSGMGTPTGTIANVFDGDFSATNINWVYGASANGKLNVTGFKKPSATVGNPDFVISFIDIKVSYRAAATATSDDRYRIVYYFGGQTYELQTWVFGTDILAGTSALYPPGINAQPGVRTFSNVAKPGGGAWTWADLASLKVGFESQVIGTNNLQRVYLYEIWITAYPTPAPTVANQVTMQPGVVMETTGGQFYVDVYVTGVTKMWGYQFQVSFDPNVLGGMEYFAYSPFVSSLPSEIGPDYFAVAGNTYNGDPVGFTGNTPVVRLYFGQVGAPGSNSTLHFTTAILADIYGATIPTTSVDGYYNRLPPPSPEFPLGVGIMMLFLPALPLAYLWRVRKKERA